MTKNSKFKDYLRKRYTLDDNQNYFPLDFYDWLESLSIHKWLDYADKFANKKVALVEKGK